jgi:predicted MFS family arabinose efflux permease
VIATDGPAPLVYAIVVVATMISVPFRPAQAALLPRLARNPAELTAANVASSTIESVASFVGPAVGGLLLVATNVETVFVIDALSFVWSAFLVLGIRVDDDAGAVRAREGFVTELKAGVGTIFRDADVRAVSLLYTAQTLVAGALNVLVVLAALELLDTGEAGVGYLNAAIGVGGIAGGFVALVLATRGRLAADMGIGLVLFGLPLVLMAAFANVPIALLALGIVGIGNSIVDVAAITLLQRLVGDELLGRVLGTLEGMLIGAIGLGALAAPALASDLGTREALLVSGAVLPVLTIASLLRLRAADRRATPPEHLAILRRVDFLAALPEPVLEHLASSAHALALAAGTTVIRAGDPGDRFYVVEEGEVEVAGKRLGPGAPFGEIALLRDVPRTATVTAATDVRLVAIEREPFVAAVTGHESTSATADEVIAARLGAFHADRRSA